MAKETKGLVLVFTGNGKGKTTAALGMALRAWGQEMKVLVLQFIKGGWKYGELIAAEKLGPNFEMRQMGEGFIKDTGGNGLEAHRAAAQKALVQAAQAVRAGEHDLVILDEINYALSYGLVDLKDVLEIIKSKPPEMHLVLTGRNVADEVVELADLVTEMREIKHPFAAGIPAQKGIEF
ncbi:cob(I)yrinic acid a,c-diamide adenosyltransferase [Desulfotomaculum arcticum]|uniref:Cob(I)yrinic acid a,c-diamide adenosyltransferase n=1 Tax=Desulfotruncus arcticus DSM 17038 TaxID=1121424 RepID=A0A1I2WCC7_9FIRM|nr:cob(I)yrinic acid a,c-diamide adenosyltransferase [Desulfotruncus arcticus]SFG99023.1 cob(I)yrinic acid a,c-diamide adenosyltransferase [Desulfotomaculum arcticum] [Desulfotruncus arcticus DSM 17038]